jgi:hypothetical protein
MKGIAGLASVLFLAAATSLSVSLLIVKARGSSLARPRAFPAVPEEVAHFGAWGIGIDPDYAQSYSFVVDRNETPTPGWLEFGIDTYLWYGSKKSAMRPPFQAVQLKIEVFEPDDEDGEKAPLLVRYSSVVEPQAGMPYRANVPFTTPLQPGSYPVRISLESVLPEVGKDELEPAFYMVFDRFDVM